MFQEGADKSNLLALKFNQSGRGTASIDRTWINVVVFSDRVAKPKPQAYS
jgi:hypothetical protein